MTKQTGDGDDRTLVKMTPDEFADSFNKGFRRSYQGLVNREFILMCLIGLGLIGFALFRYFAGG